jgi:2Fe-2S ferredoxin
MSDTVSVTVTDRNGMTKREQLNVGERLMIELANAGYDIDITCGGVINCGTCHVYVDDEWIGRLSTPSDEESDLLSGLGTCRATSRLSCQIVMTAPLDGLELTIAPREL